jgi:GT2 family glycosyltransferase
MNAGTDLYKNINIDPQLKLSIVVINWNTWQDTLECLESLKNSEYKYFTVLLIDNGSTNDSVERMKEWLARYGFGIKHVLLENRTNLGFAGGNNIGIAYAVEKGYKYIMLLNNDTVIAPKALGHLIDTMEHDPDWGVITPQIRYHGEPERIANSGGRLTIFGHRNYYDSDRLTSECPGDSVRRITFITGCALLVRSEILKSVGGLSDHFFFGEEDFDFSLKMKKQGVKMGCVRKAVVFHKIGTTRKKAFPNIQSVFLHYFNRFINMKYHYLHFYWQIWRMISLLYIMPLVYFRYHYPILVIIKMSRLLIKYSDSCTEVSRENIDKACKELSQCC